MPMTTEQTNNFLSRLRDWADKARELAEEGAALADEHAKRGSPTEFPLKSGNLQPIEDSDYLSLITSVTNYQTYFWNFNANLTDTDVPINPSGNGTNVVKVSRGT